MRRGSVVVAQTCPACGVQVGPGDLICFTCGANVPRSRQQTDDFPVPVTVMQETITPARASGPISATVLRLAFPAGNVEVPAGTSVVLGRDPAESLVAAAFVGCENVSRRHATITVDDHGRATIRDEQSTNGTFVNGDRLPPDIDVRIVDGDMVRLAADVNGSVVLPGKEPDPASLSLEA